MLRSLGRATNFVLKIHVACLEVRTEFPDTAPVRLYPAIDGLYVTSLNQSDLLKFVRRVMENLAANFVLEKNNEYRFLVKGAIAFGPVIHGSDCLKASDTLSNYPSHASQVLIGAPLAQANQAERAAPPYGIYVHESARSMAPPGDEPLKSPFLVWWEPGQNSEGIASRLRTAVRQWLAWARLRPSTLLYDPARIDAHAALFEEYFIDSDVKSKVTEPLGVAGRSATRPTTAPRSPRMRRAE